MMLIRMYAVYLLMLTAVVTIEAARKGSKQCGPPSKEKRQELYKDILTEYLTGTHTYNIIRHFRNNRPEPLGFGGRIAARPVLKRHRTFRQRLYGESRCKRTVLFERTTSEASTCPWYVELHIDPQREPLSIAKAKCSCKECYTGVGSNSLKAGLCQPVNTYIPVIRWGRNRKTKHCEYYTDLETVPVGCTCRRAA